jgi:hypothetical protein
MRRTRLLMWRSGTLVWRPGETTFLTECPMGHERTITVDQRTPEQDWTLTCPLCGGEHRLVAPEILRSDL